MTQLKPLISFFCLSSLFLNRAAAQVPTVQDCLGAIPVCQDVFIQNNAFSGTGNYPGEITYPLSCLVSGEKNDVWYTFTVQTSDTLNFTITPNNGGDDYDWAIFDLTNHQCEDIASISVQVSCNYAGNNCCGGATGANYHGTPPIPAFQQSSPVFYVYAGHTYVLNISNYTSSQGGYTLDFSASLAQIYDNIPPVIDSVTAALSCGEDSITVYFSENIYCNSVDATDFTFTGPGGPYTVNSISNGNCGVGADYASQYVLKFSPAIPIGGVFSLNLVDTVYDLCYNAPVLPANIPVAVNTVLINTVQTDVLCFGGTNGTATVQPAGNYTYSWNTVPVQTTQTATGLSAAGYTVTVTPPLGCPAQANVTILEPPALALSSSVVNSSNCGSSNGSASITVTGGTPSYTYQWAPSGGISSSASNITGGAYTVTTTDQNGCTLTTLLNVPFDGMTAGITASQDISCFGGSDGNATVGVTVGSGNYLFQWYDNTFNPIAGATSSTISNQPAGTYQVIVTDLQGCGDTVSVTLTEPAAAVTAIVTPVITSCGGNNGSISVSPSGGTAPYTYLWSNASTTDTIFNLAAGNYTVTVTDDNGCTLTGADSVKSSAVPIINLGTIKDVTCFGGNDGSASVNPSGGIAPYTVNWSNGSTGNAVNNFAAGIYVVTVEDFTGCTVTESFTVNQASQLVLNASAGTTICIGDSANLAVVASGGTSPYTYLWSNGNTSNGIVVTPVVTSTYTVTVTDSIGCPSGVSSITVTVNPPLSVSLFPDTSICRGTAITVTVSASGGNGNFQYLWNNGETTTSVTMTPGQDTTVTVTLEDNCSTPAVSASVNIFLVDAPLVNFTYAPSEGCEPLMVVFFDSSATIPNSTWTWNFHDGSFSADPNPSHEFNNSGLYDVTLTVTNPYNCAGTITKPQIINVFQRPEPLFDFDPRSPTLYNPTVHFKDQSEGATIWTWTFGDNSPPSNDQNPVHTYADTGIYRVKLIVSNLNQCIDSIEFIVHVEDEYSFYVPAAFTPDGNGKNDFFEVFGVGISSYNVSIFNRYGGLVHQVSNKQQVWDGRFNGMEAEQGVYVYSIDLVEQNGRKHQVKGHVTLVR